MELNGVLAISGKPGLYKLVSQTKTGLIVESFGDGKRIPVYSAHQISALEEISIFTYEDDLPLEDAFKMMFESLNGEKAPSHKSSAKDLEGFLEKAIPEYDKERVYLSDIKKLVRWYNQLHENNLLVFDDENEVSDITDKEADEESPEKQ